MISIIFSVKDFFASQKIEAVSFGCKHVKFKSIWHSLIIFPRTLNRKKDFFTSTFNSSDLQNQVDILHFKIYLKTNPCVQFLKKVFKFMPRVLLKNVQTKQLTWGSLGCLGLSNYNLPTQNIMIHTKNNINSWWKISLNKSWLRKWVEKGFPPIFNQLTVKIS